MEKKNIKDLGFVVEKNDNYFITDRGERGFCKDRFAIGDSLILKGNECSVKSNKQQVLPMGEDDEANLIKGGRDDRRK